MNLQEEIQTLLEKVGPTIPAETAKIMAEATEKLSKSGIVSRALGQGDKAPIFELPNVLWQMVSSAALLQDGPLVVSFYRGTW